MDVNSDGYTRVSEEEYESPWEIPERFLPRVHWVAMVPTKAVCYLSIPDCRKGGVWRRLYPLTFIMAVVWISVFTYVMVWMITIIGALSVDKLFSGYVCWKRKGFVGAGTLPALFVEVGRGVGGGGVFVDKLFRL